MKLMLDRARIRKWLFLIVVVGAVLTYLYLVVMASFEKSKGWHGYPRSGHSIPEYTEEIERDCSVAFKKTTLTPHQEVSTPNLKHSYPEYREHASIWLLDSASTDMYEIGLLNNPICMKFVLDRMASNASRRILVIYDRSANREALVIRNY